MNKRFFNQQNLTRRLRMLFVLFALLLMPLGVWAQDESYFGINISSGGVFVTDVNADNILGDGTMSYDIEHNILTLNGIDLSFTSNVSYDAFIAMVDTDHPDLTVHLVGNNKLTLGDKACVFNGWGITFTTDAANPGSLTINTGDNWGGALFIYNPDPTSTPLEVAYSNGLSLIQNGDSYIIGKSYGLTVAGVQVTNANASNVLGNDFKSVSYNPTSSTLTLKGAHLDSKVISIGEGVEELKVRLVGYNWLGTSTSVFEKAATTKLTFTTSTTFPGSLQLSSALSGDNIFYENGLSYNDGNKVIEKNLNNTTVVSFTGFVNYVNSNDGNNSYIYSSNVEFHASYATAPIANSVFVSPKGTNTELSMWPASFSGISLINKIMVQFDWGTCTNTNVTVQVRGMKYDEQEMEYSFDGKTYSDAIFLSTADADGIVVIPLTGEITSDKFELYFSSGAGFSFYPLNYAFISSAAYDLWIGDTRVTTDNASNVLGDGKVSFTENVGADTGSTYTLTLKGTDIAGQVKVGLANLTVDVQGTNTITVPEGNVFRLMNDETPGTCYLTIKTSTADGKLTLTSTSSELIERGGVFDYVSVDKKFNITIDKSLALIQPNNSGRLTDGSYHTAYFAPAYGVAIENSAGGKTEIYEGNATDVFGDGKVSFDKSSHTLTLNNAGSFEAISTTLSTLDIDLVGSNSLYRESNGSIFESASGDAVTINLKSTGATKGSLTIETPANYGATLKGDNVTLTPVDPIVLLSSDVTENKGTLVYGVSYGLTVAGVTVSNVNASNVLGGETATVVFTPANATEATPATLTLNGADNLGTILSGLENLKVVINGDNAAVQVLANTDVDGDKNITFAGGTNGGSLTITAGNDESAVSEFASVSYDGAYPAADVPFGYGKPDSNSPKGYVKSHMMGDNSYLNSLTITTVPHYPIWLYTNVTTLTQVDNTNKNTLLGASGDVSFDGNHTLSLKNSVNCSTRIVSGLSELTISIDGDCIIESPDSGSVVRSINASAPLTIEKASGASSASLKLAAVSYTAVKAFASLDYTGLILLSKGATYTSGALNDSDGNPLNVAIFTSSLKKPTLRMYYPDVDNFSGNPYYKFVNPNGGGTVKYSRFFASESIHDEINQTYNDGTFDVMIDSKWAPVVCKVWVEANGSVSDTLYACRLDVENMEATYGDTNVPVPTLLPQAVDGVTTTYALRDTDVETHAANITSDGTISLLSPGQEWLKATFTVGDGVEYIKNASNEVPSAEFYIVVKPSKPTLSHETGSYAGTQTVTFTDEFVDNKNITAWYYTYEGEEPADPTVNPVPDGGIPVSSSENVAVYYRLRYDENDNVDLFAYSDTTNVAITILEDIDNCTVSGNGNVTYTGAAQTPTLTVTPEAGGDALVLGTDYTVSYKKGETAVESMIDAGDYTIVITAKEGSAYGGTKEVDFTIDQANLGDVTIAPIADQTYTGSQITPTDITVTFNGNAVSEDEYTISYGTNINVGEGTVTLTSKNKNFSTTSTKGATFTIVAKTLTADMVISVASVTYTGSAVEPELTIRDGDLDLEKGTDYTVIYSDNVSAGTNTAKATITGKGNYTGSADKMFTINKAQLTVTPDDKTYNVGDNIELTVSYDGFVDGETETVLTTQPTASYGTADVTKPGSYEITASGGVAQNYDFIYETGTLTINRVLDVSFASNTWATYCGTENLATPEGLQAYIVTAVGTSAVTTSAIDYIPANTAVLLNDVEGKAVSANIAASAYTGVLDPTICEDNILQGGVAVDVSSITGGTVYVLYKDKFKRATGGTIPANRGYLVVAPSSGNAPELSITIGDDTTGIGMVGCDSVATDNDEWYTLDGQKLQQAPTQKGLYIKNGKKVVINKK